MYIYCYLIETDYYLGFERFLVTTEELYSIFQTIKPTKLHVLCNTESSALVGCLPRLNHKFVRGRQVILRILPKSQIPLNRSLCGSKDDNREQYDGITMSSRVDAHESRTVSRRLVFSSPIPSARIFRESNFSLDLSGFGTLEDEIDKTSDSVVCPENVKDRCWFQIQSSLTGFLDTFKFDI